MVSVKDEGIGIDKDYQEKIFERFYRVEGKSEKTFPGFGIGLFIASEIIKRHGGNIGVSSNRGKGSRFYFSLPLHGEND
jgi:signal transduction histidine kinase